MLIGVVFSKQPDADCSSGCIALDSFAREGGEQTPAVLRLMKLSGPGPPATTSSNYDSQLSRDYARDTQLCMYTAPYTTIIVYTLLGGLRSATKSNRENCSTLVINQ